MIVTAKTVGIELFVSKVAHSDGEADSRFDLDWRLVLGLAVLLLVRHVLVAMVLLEWRHEGLELLQRFPDSDVLLWGVPPLVLAGDISQAPRLANDSDERASAAGACGVPMVPIGPPLPTHPA